MALDHFDRIDWEDLDETDAANAALLEKRDEHERYESDEATVDVVESKDSTARCYVLYDRDPSNPRVDFDNAGHMVMFKNWRNRAYNMGDESAFYDLDDFEETTSEWTGDNRVAVILSLHVRGNGDGIFSGAYSDGAEGFIYLTRGDCLKEWGYKRLNAARIAKLKSYLKGEVETYDQYLTGDVYGYIVVGGPNDGDSCWGYFGLKYAREEAKAMVE